MTTLNFVYFSGRPRAHRAPPGAHERGGVVELGDAAVEAHLNDQRGELPQDGQPARRPRKHHLGHQKGRNPQICTE